VVQPAATGYNIAGRRVASATEWRWRTFPVFFTFALTLFLTATLMEIFAGTGLGWLIAFAGTLCTAAALANLVVVRFIAPRVGPRQRD
jgi:hypothetical protein